MTSNQNPNWVKPVALAAILGGLGTLAWWLEFQKKPQQEALKENEKKPFTLPKESSIASLRIEDSQKSFGMKCLDAACKSGSNAKWELEQPLKARADDTNVNSLLSAINNLQASDVFDLKEETPEKRAAIIKEYGLSPDERKSSATRKIRIQTPTGESWVAYFGGTHPVNDGMFTIIEHSLPGQAPTLDETHVFLTPSFFKSNFDHNLTYWRDKKVLSVNASEVQSFKIEGKLGGGAPGTRPTWIEGQKKDGLWLLKTADGEFTGDIENIDNMLTGAAFLVAKEIAAEQKDSSEAKKILKPTSKLLSLTLTTAKAPVQLTIFEEAGKPDMTRLFAVASNLDPLFELQNGARNQLGKTLKDLRLNKLITSVDRFGAKKLEFASTALGSTPLTLLYANGKWSATDGSEVSDPKVQSTLDKLSGSRIQDFLPPAAKDENAPGATRVTLWSETDAKAAPKRQVLFWKKDGKLYARDLLSPRQEVFLVDTSVQDGLPSDRNYFKASAAPAAPVSKK